MAVLKARIQFKKNSSWSKAISEVVVLLVSKSTSKGNEGVQLPAKAPASLSKNLESLKNFKANFQQMEQIGGPGSQIEGFNPGVRLLLVGIGERKNLHAQNLLSLGGKIAQELKKNKVESASIVIDAALDLVKSSSQEAKDFASRSLNSGIQGSESVVRFLIEGLQLGLYSFDQYRSNKDEKPSKMIEIELLSEKISPSAKITEAMNLAQICSEAVFLTRDLQTIPGGDLRPSQLVKRAEDLAKELKIKSTILDSKKLASEGLHGILSVGQGSDDPPSLIVLESKSSNPKAPTICLVGKGVTFDTGGISIKPAAGMEEMKYDMSGAASVLGAIYGLCKLKAPINVIGIVPTAENMPSGNAIRPGDIYTAYNGKTVEVLNTDAEGRLILADALHYAKQFSPDAVVDVATLTGAVIIALGGVASAVMGNDGNLIKGFSDASNGIGERVWELPLYPEYGEDMKSKIADIKNIGGRRDAGSQKGGAFLNYFVEDAYPWIHVDIAGSAMQPQDQGAHCPAGAGSGVPTRSLIEISRNLKKHFPKALMSPKAPKANAKTSEKTSSKKATAKTAAKSTKSSTQKKA